jgi:hypothetical protein
MVKIVCILHSFVISTAKLVEFTFVYCFLCRVFGDWHASNYFLPHTCAYHISSDFYALRAQKGMSTYFITRTTEQISMKFDIGVSALIDIKTNLILVDVCQM